jgi:beta-mannosidase
MECIGADGLARVQQAAAGWMPAQVPGEIHLDLMRAGQMPEPAVGANMPECRWPETRSWWYQTRLETGVDFLRHERQQLVFDGLDLYAQVFVNGQLVGEAANAFVPAVFDLKHFLVEGMNELVVRLTAGSELAPDATPPGQEQAPQPNLAADGAIPNPAPEGDPGRGRMWPGKKWLRKPQFTYGWDWVDALPNIGIWRGVHLEGRSLAVLEDIRLDALRDGERVFLELEAVVENLHPWAQRRCLLTLKVQPPDNRPAITRQYDLDVPPGRMPVRDCIEIPDPRLWWPNGMGEQPLYRVRACVTDAAGTLCDERCFHVGLRTLEIDRTRLEEGSRFCIRVNGQEVFCRGGNIGPHDAILARISDAKYESLVAEARNANMNMIRINGCSIYEGPAFYDACDRMGILVWHDFMLTCTTYPEQDKQFCDAIQAEAQSVIRMLRHHPSIALWCGNNECTWGFRDWWNPDKAKPLDVGGQAFYSQMLPDLCRLLDPKRPYWPSSPAGGDDPNDELTGDCHWWLPFFMHPDVNRRIRHEVFDECRSRFVSEYGVIGPPHLDSLREYLAPKEPQPGTLAWRMHTNMFEKDTVPAAIRLHYADPETLSVPEYVRYGQVFQALVHGHAMEALRFRKHDPQDDCAGALIWSYSDCWGEIGWSILDYYLRRKASYYAFRRACAPLKVIVRRRGDRLVTRIVNDTLCPASVTVEAGWWRLDGSERQLETHAVQVPANSMTEVASASLAATARDPRHWLYAAVLRQPDGQPLDQSVWTLAPHRELALADPLVEVEDAGDGWLHVSSPVYCHAVHVEDHGRELLSDNWFDLLPGVPVRIRRPDGQSSAQMRFEVVTTRPAGA